MPDLTDRDIERMPSWRKDYLEIFGWRHKPAKVFPGTCDACLYGTDRNEHTEGCQRADWVIKPSGEFDHHEEPVVKASYGFVKKFDSGKRPVRVKILG